MKLRKISLLTVFVGSIALLSYIAKSDKDFGVYVFNPYTRMQDRTLYNENAQFLNTTTTGDFAFTDEIKPDGQKCSNGQILKKTGDNDWDCAIDVSGGGGGGGNVATSTPETSGNIAYWTSTSATPATLGSVSSLYWDNAISKLTATNIASVRSTSTSATTTDYIMSGSGTVNTLDFASGDLYVADDLEVDGTITGNVTGTLTGNASTASALAANGANCSSGNFPLGVDASGVVESCTANQDTLDDLSDNTTTQLAEGTNLYYTSDRVNSLINASSTIGYAGGCSSTQVLKWNGTRWDCGNDTDTNTTGQNGAWETLFTNALTPTSSASGVYVMASSTFDSDLRVNGMLRATSSLDYWFSTKTTTNLTEGSNLYYTDERVDDRTAALIQNGTGLTWTYNDAGNTLTGNVALVAGTAIDTTGVTVDWDSTEVEATTWGAGGNSSNLWTFNLLGTDPTITIQSGGFTIGSNATVTSRFVAGGTPTNNFADLWVDGDSYTKGNATTTGSMNIGSLTTASCDVKSDTNGLLYCGTDATGGGGSGANGAWEQSPTFLNTLRPTNTSAGLYVAGKSTSTIDFWIGSGGTANWLDLTGGDLYVQDDAEIDDNLAVGGRTTSTANLWIGGTSNGGLFDISAKGWKYYGTSKPLKSIVLTGAGGTEFSATTTKRLMDLGGVGTTRTYVLDYRDNGTASSSAQWQIVMPDNWDAGTVNAIFYMTATTTSASSGRCTMCIRGASFTSADAFTGDKWGTSVCQNLAQTTANGLEIGTSTAAITVGNTPAAGDVVNWEVWRNSNDDGRANYCGLVSVKIEYSTNADSN